LRMAARKVIVKRLASIHDLGAMTVLCTDKTGTLTAGEMTVTTIRTVDRSYDVSGVGYDPIGAFSAGGRPVDVRDHTDLEMALETGVAAGRGASGQAGHDGCH